MQPNKHNTPETANQDGSAEGNPELADLQNQIGQLKKELAELKKHGVALKKQMRHVNKHDHKRQKFVPRTHRTRISSPKRSD